MTVNITAAKLRQCVQFALLVAIFGLLLWSQPWDSSSNSAETRTITVSGEATIEAEPDTFTFNPYFEQEGTDQDALKEALSVQANEAVEKLKELGVEDSDIKLDVSSYDYWYWDEDEEGRLSAYITIEIPAGDLVQEVQDYLLTTDAKGQLSPRASFSEEKRKNLDAQAVELASADAKSKAAVQASLFDAELGDVVTVSQGRDSIFGYPEPVALESREASLDMASSSIPVLPGEQEYKQTVTVVYELQ
jgi:uncharacterized protein YggE